MSKGNLDSLSHDELYYKPRYRLLKKETLVGPVTALAIDTFSVSTDDNEEQETNNVDIELCLIARGPYVNIVPLNVTPKENEIFTHIAFNSQFENESGTVHGLIKVENFSSRKFNLWAFFGGRKLAFALIDMIKVSLIYKSSSQRVDTDISLPFDIYTFDDGMQQTAPYLSLSDWIWDIRVIAANYKCDDSKKIKFVSAVGLAQNTVEIWSFSSMENQQSPKRNDPPPLYPCKLRKIICEKRCITYSMSFFGWKNDFNYSTNGENQIKGEDLDLAVGVGTVTNQILVWKVIEGADGNHIINGLQNCDKDSFRNSSSALYNSHLHIKEVSHSLTGHLGVIYSVKFGGNVYIASTSDDRTVRLWKNFCSDQMFNTSLKENQSETSANVKMITDTKISRYSLIWTGFGHAARVWDCDFISSQYDQGIGGIISSGEDGYLKIWNIADGTLLKTLKGHACQSIWKIRSTKKHTKNVNYSLAISGANDGSVNLWDLNYFLANPYSHQKKFTLPNDQKVCGMCFYSDHEGQKLLVTTKDGAVAILDPRTKDWMQVGVWTSQDHEINPEHGSCVSVHPNNVAAVIGTTKGDIVLFPLQSLDKQLIFGSARKYLAIQSLTWLDSGNILAFHVKGIVTWWEYTSVSELNNSEGTIGIKRVLDMNMQGVTIGVPISHYYDRTTQLIFIGDSRGNIAMFKANMENVESKLSSRIDHVVQKPLDLLIYAHKKEHVTGIIATSDGRGILSVGNDGCLHESTIIKDETTLNLQKCHSRPISNLTGVSYIWRSETGALIVGGYHGNAFVVVDVTTNKQLLHIDSGGRTRKIALWIDPNNTSSFKYVIAICIANKKAPFEIMIHSSPIQLYSLPLTLPYQLRAPYHGETILDVAACNLGGTLFIASGSNDCSIKLSVVSKSSITLFKELPPHESCIRTLCFSQHIGSKSLLFIAAGGKLITTVYRVEDNGNGDVSIHFLCTTKLPVKTSIDHRMNAVKVIPIKATSKHMMLAGDSDGSLHFTILTEDLGQPRKAESLVLTQDSRPILSLELVRLSDHFILAIVGTTTGNIDLWMFLQDQEGCIHPEEKPTMTIEAHTMGTNSISAKIVEKEFCGHKEQVKVIVCSGGDDQALTLNLLCISFPQNNEVNKVNIEVVATTTKKEACASAIKGTALVGDYLHGFRAYTTGYDQRLAMWAIFIYDEDKDFKIVIDLLSSSPIDIKDINSLCQSVCTDNEGDSKEYIIAGGEGMELFSFESNIWNAASALRKCNKLLITCGSGFSSDSGLDTYEAMPEEYKEMCNPLRLVDSLQRFQQFWLRFSEEYERVSPHLGYHILADFCGGGKIKGLQSKSLKSENCISPWWIYSSNVDGHFDSFDCFKDTICEIHGKAAEFRCACSSGYSEGSERHSQEWENWNKHYTPSSCSRKGQVYNYKSVIAKADEIVIRCSECKTPMRPNVLMFHDTDEHVLKDINDSRNIYQTWEAQMEQKVIGEGQNLVILELGAGENITAIRDETEEVFHDVQRSLQRKQSSSGSVTLIRINPRKSISANQPGSVVHLLHKAEHALLMINQALGQH